MVFAPADPSEVVAHTLPRLHRLDLTDVICDAEACPPVIGNVQVYRDKHHLSATFAATLAPALAPHLRRWLDERQRLAAARVGREERAIR